jgi:hypothetical protein
MQFFLQIIFAFAILNMLNVYYFINLRRLNVKNALLAVLVVLGLGSVATSFADNAAPGSNPAQIYHEGKC